jgi:hypothetical protein
VKDRLLVIGLACIMFLSGMVFSRLLDKKGVEKTPYESLATQFEQEFELSKNRSNHLRELLRFHYEKRQRIMQRHESTLDTQQGRELDEEDQTFMALIRDMVLPPHQRELFDKLLAGTETLFPAR